MVRKHHKVYIPYYTCDVLLEPFRKLGVAYEYYQINANLEIAEKLVLQQGEAFFTPTTLD